MAAKTVPAGRGGQLRSGWAALRLIAAGMLILVVLGATMREANATTQTQMPDDLTGYQFVDECLKAGGKVYGAGKDVITCWYAGTTGLRTQRNFVTRTCTTWWSFYPGIEAPTTHGSVTGGTATTGEATPGNDRPNLGTRSTANPGTILVIEDDEQP